MTEYSDNYNKVTAIRAIDGQGGVIEFASKLTREELEDLFVLTFENHFMDPSTGTLRELASIILSGAENDEGQFGHDAAREGCPVECKPVSYSSNSTKQSADGHGKINEYSQSRHEKFLRDDLIMQQSQFFDGLCGWIIEFPYTDSVFVNHMMKQMTRTTSGRVCGRFSYLQWMNCPNVVVRYINHDVIRQNRFNIVGGSRKTHLYEWLMDQKKKD